MKNSISNIWLLSIVIAFILIFAAYLTVTLNYTKAFKMKNEVLSIIEKNKGITDTSGVVKVNSIVKSGLKVSSPKSAMGTINAFLYSSGYKVTGACPKSGSDGIWYGVKDISNFGTKKYAVEQVKTTEKIYYYCFSKKMRYRCDRGFKTNDQMGTYYYDILLFYKLELPVLGDLFTFSVEGNTGDIYKIQDTRSGTCA